MRTSDNKATPQPIEEMHNMTYNLGQRDLQFLRHNPGFVYRMRQRGPYRIRLKPTPHGWPKIAEWRVYFNWTQVELAHRAGLAVGTVSGIEAQKVGFGQESLGKLARAFGVSIGVLFDINPKQHPECHQLRINARIPRPRLVIPPANPVLDKDY